MKDCFSSRIQWIHPLSQFSFVVSMEISIENVDEWKEGGRMEGEKSESSLERKERNGTHSSELKDEEYNTGVSSL